METEKEKITELTEEKEIAAEEKADNAAEKTVEADATKAENAEEKLTPEQIKLKRRNEIIRILKFVGFSCSAGVIQFVVFTILNEVLHLIYWMVINLVTEYLFNQFVVYRKSMNTNALGKKENAALEAAGKHDGAEKEEDKAEDKGDENA